MSIDPADIPVGQQGVIAYAASKERVKAALEEMRELGKLAFREMASTLFARFPALDSFNWEQYTPYFNDGDECIFSVKVDRYGDRPEGISVNGEASWELPDKLIPIACDCVDFLRTFEESELKEMFGDHASVTVNRNGTVSIDTCSHD